MGDYSTYCCGHYYHRCGCYFIIFCKLVDLTTLTIFIAHYIFFTKFGFFKRKKVGDDEADLTTWQSPGDAGGETMPQETESSPATKDSA